MKFAGDVEHGQNEKGPKEEAEAAPQEIRLSTSHFSEDEIRWKCRRGPQKGWWQCDVNYVEKFSFKLTEERSQEFEGVEELYLAVDVVKDATHLSFEIWGGRHRGRAVAWKVAKILETVDKPVHLESLAVTGCFDVAKLEEISFIFGAMESGKLIQLKSVSIEGIEVRDADVECMARAMKAGFCPSLSKITLDRNDISTEGWKCFAASLQYVPSLQRLNLVGNKKIESEHLVLAKAMESCPLSVLKTLDLRRTGMGDEGCKAYAKAMSSKSLPALEDMDFGENEIGEIGATALADAIGSGNLSNLVRIALSHNTKGTLGVGHMALGKAMGSIQLAVLKTLYLSSTGMGDEGCKAYAKAMSSRSLPALEDMDFGSNEIGEIGVIALAEAIRSGNLSNLTRIELSRNEIRSGHEALGKAMGSCQLPALKTLRLNSTRMGDEGCKAYAKAMSSGNLPALENIYFSYNEFRKIGAEALADAIGSDNLSNLTRIKLKRNEIRCGHVTLGKAMGSCQLPALKTLRLNATRMGDEGCKAYAKAMSSRSLPALEDIDFESNEIGEIGAIAIADAIGSGSLSNLNRIKLSNNEIGSGHVVLGKAIGSCQLTALKTLGLNSTRMGDEGCKAYSKAMSSRSLPALEDMDFRFNEIGEIGAIALADAIGSGNLSNLIRIELSSNEIGFGHVALEKAMGSRQVPALKRLCLRGSRMGDQGCEAYAKAMSAGNLPALEDMDFEDNGIGEIGAIAFAGAIGSGNLSNLTRIELSRNKIGSGHVALGKAMASCQLPALKKLVLRGTGMGDEGCKAYAKAMSSRSLPALENMDFGLNEIGEIGAIAFADAIGTRNLSNLTRIELSRNKIGSGHVALGKAMGSSQLPALKSLCLRGTGMRDEGCKAYAKAISSRSLPAVADMDFESNEIGEIGAIALADAIGLGTLSNLTRLALSRNKIGSGHVALGKAIRSCQLPALKRLCLRGTRMGDEGCEAYAQAMSSGRLPALEDMEFEDNKIGEMGAIAVAEAIESGNLSNLTKIVLSRNKIGSGHVSLGKAMGLCQLPALETLSLLGTGMGDDGCEAYAKAMSSGKLSTLKQILFSGNEIGEIGATALAEALRSGYVSNLTRINLSKNFDIADEGICGLAAAFSSSTTGSAVPNLYFLNLSSIGLSERGLLSLSDVLASGPLNSLNELDLCYNKPTERIAQGLVSALATNNALKLHIKFEWNLFPELDRLKDQMLERNRRITELLLDLGRLVPATVGKVYLCGNPMVGKTTLRKSLQRTFWKALCTRERRPHEEERTRGIHVSHVVSKAKSDEKSITLMIWDMAGQEEYHLVHNAFFPDLAFVGGKATTFLIVCSSREREEVEEGLDYWLQFIACSSINNIQSARHVLVVRNLKKGERDSHDWQWWEELLKFHKDKFRGYLEVETTPFVLDVRKRRFVKGLRECLMARARHNLADKTIPEVCQFIEKKLDSWNKEKKEFPIMHWSEFCHKVWRQFLEESSKEMEENPPNDNLMEAAVRYLNEAGIVLHIDTNFPSEWAVPNKRFVVVQPNWFLTEVAGSVFLPKSMAIRGEIAFRHKVDRKTGSISRADLDDFFKKGKLNEWVGHGSEDLIAILLWLGLCYMGHQNNVFFPALIVEDDTHLEFWDKSENDGVHGQWVMGYSVEQKKGEIGLAPLSLWHKFQVELAQTSKYNMLKHNDFFAGKHFVTFKVDHMVVLIEVNAKNSRPTFDCVDIFVKPLWKNSEDPLSNLEKRKECQVDLAGELVETFLRLWNQICPGLSYLQRVVWPWPVSCPRPTSREKILEVKEVQENVVKPDLDRQMMWMVGGSEGIRWEQLLSSKETKYALESIAGKVHLIAEGVEEAVELGIFSSDILEEDRETKASTSNSNDHEAWILSQRLPELTYGVSNTEIHLMEATRQENEYRMPGDSVVVKEMEEVDELANQGQDNLAAQVRSLVTLVAQVLEEVRAGFRGVHTRIEDLRSDVRDGLRKVLHIQEDLIRKVQKQMQLFLEDRERSCPRFIYLGRKNSGTWMTLKEALSPSVKVHVHFLCEAKFDDGENTGPFDDYARHVVKDQKGLDLSQLKDWAKKILPWLKVSIAILFFSAKVGANVVAPGLGLAIPDFTAWQQATTFSESIALATGYSNAELGKLEEADIHVDKVIQSGAGVTADRAHELYGDCRRIMIEELEKLSQAEYNARVGLRKVFLRSRNKDSHVVWICRDCYEKFRNDMPGLLTEL